MIASVLERIGPEARGLRWISASDSSRVGEEGEDMLGTDGGAPDVILGKRVKLTRYCERNIQQSTKANR